MRNSDLTPPARAVPHAIGQCSHMANQCDCHRPNNRRSAQAPSTPIRPTYYAFMT